MRTSCISWNNFWHTLDSYLRQVLQFAFSVTNALLVPTFFVAILYLKEFKFDLVIVDPKVGDFAHNVQNSGFQLRERVVLRSIREPKWVAIGYAEFHTKNVIHTSFLELLQAAMKPRPIVGDQPLKVLVVHENVVVVKITLRTLEKLGHVVDYAMNTADGVSKAQSSSYDLSMLFRLICKCLQSCSIPWLRCS